MLGKPIPAAMDRENVLFTMVSGPFGEKYGRAEAVEASASFCKSHRCHVQSFTTRALFFVSKALEYLSPSRRERPYTHSTVQRSTQAYLEGLASSIFTLCPCGKNPESYRIYEAILAGSIPIVHNSSISANNHTSCYQPYKFLSDLGAPILFIQSWDELPALLKPYMALPSLAYHHQQRLLSWYADVFVPYLRQLSVGIITETMLPNA